MPVKVITDSVADLPKEIVNTLGIIVVPLLVRFGEKEYRDEDAGQMRSSFECHRFPTIRSMVSASARASSSPT